jgi:hypothetical protein
MKKETASLNLYFGPPWGVNLSPEFERRQKAGITPAWFSDQGLNRVEVVG